MVVGTLLVDNAFESPLPFVVVVCNVGYEVGVSTIALTHDAIFVIAKFSCPQPQCVLILIGVASSLKRGHRVLDGAIVVERGFEKILVKHHLKSAQVLILLASQ